MLDLGKIHRN